MGGGKLLADKVEVSRAGPNGEHPILCRVEVLDVNDPPSLRRTAELISIANSRFTGPWSYMFGRDNWQDLTWVMERSLWLKAGTTYIFRSLDLEASNGIDIVATCSVEPSTYGFPTKWDMLRCGLLKMPFLFGMSPTNRLLEIESWFKAGPKHSDRYPDQEVYKLHMVAVDEALQGRGIGTKMVAFLIDEVCDPSNPITLDTQRHENVKFYSTRFGFKVADERIFHEGEKDMFNSWIMDLVRTDGSTDL
eukprot:Clim_evm138s149 gene=Clim_evmTU138s149